MVSNKVQLDTLGPRQAKSHQHISSYRFYMETKDYLDILFVSEFGFFLFFWPKLGPGALNFIFLFYFLI